MTGAQLDEARELARETGLEQYISDGWRDVREAMAYLRRLEAQLERRRIERSHSAIKPLFQWKDGQVAPLST